MNTGARFRAVYSEYGMGSGHTCQRCCNLRKHPTQSSSFICMAYGYKEGVNCTWDLYTNSCGLYNKPFLALRPARRPLVELVTPKEKPKEDTEQESLF